MIALSGSPPESWLDVVLPVDKQGGITSFDVVRSIRRISGVRKVGHAGTLDPMATGLLICLVGKSTRRMRDFLEMPKVYSGVMRLGEVTPSYDAETDVSRRVAVPEIPAEKLESVRSSFMGTIIQETPMYSAVRVGGERLYHKARRGERVTVPLRVVTIDRFELGCREDRDLPFEVTCSKGTYIRSLANEFGRKLGIGAHLVALRRQQIGEFHVDQAWNLEDLAALQSLSGSRDGAQT